MPATHSVLNHCNNILGNQQQDSQTYSELFPEIDSAPSNSEDDFDLYNMFKRINPKYQRTHQKQNQHIIQNIHVEFVIKVLTKTSRQYFVHFVPNGYTESVMVPLLRNIIF